MEWTELDGSDWTLPASRNKTKLDLVRPLSRAAMQLLAALPRSGSYVFSSDGVGPFTSFSNAKAALDGASGTKGWTIHDLRRTARSLMSRAGVPTDHAERCLGHVIGGVRGVYDRHEYHAEKARAFEMLAGEIGRIVSGGSPSRADEEGQAMNEEYDMGIDGRAWIEKYVSLTENGWASFEDAANFIADHLDVAIGVAQRMLREACTSGDVRSQQLILDERFGWVPEPIKPKEWLEDQMDLKWQQREDFLRVLYYGMEDDGDRPEYKDLEWEWFPIDTLPDNIQELYLKVYNARQQLREARKKLIQHVGVYVNKADCEHWLDKLKPEAQSTVGGKQSRIIRLLADMFPAGVPSRDECPRQPLTAELVKRDPSLKPLDPKTLKTAIDFYNRQQGNAGKR